MKDEATWAAAREAVRQEWGVKDVPDTPAWLKSANAFGARYADPVSAIWQAKVDELRVKKDV